VIKTGDRKNYRKPIVKAGKEKELEKVTIKADKRKGYKTFLRLEKRLIY
jgi:hypothetical protein